MPREIDDWVKIQKLQAVAVEEQKKARAVRAIGHAIGHGDEEISYNTAPAMEIV